MQSEVCRVRCAELGLEETNAKCGKLSLEAIQPSEYV